MSRQDILKCKAQSVLIGQVVPPLFKTCLLTGHQPALSPSDSFYLSFLQFHFTIYCYGWHRASEMYNIESSVSFRIFANPLDLQPRREKRESRCCFTTKSVSSFPPSNAVSLFLSLVLFFFLLLPGPRSAEWESDSAPRQGRNCAG